MAAAMLLMMRPGLLAGDIRFRPLSPFWHDQPTRLDGTPVRSAFRQPGSPLGLTMATVRRTASHPAGLENRHWCLFGIPLQP